MSKRSVFTTITPLPSYMSRETAMATLRDHFEMIDLNPLVIARRRLEIPPPCASPEEAQAKWYEITDKITYMPGVQSSVSYNSCFNDLPDGLQTHTFAPAGVELRGRWTIGGSLPGEPPEPAELGLGVPRHGLYLREQTDLRCSFLLTAFVKKNLKKSHASVVEKMLQKAKDGLGPESEPAKIMPVSSGYASSGHVRTTSQNFSRPLSATHSAYGSESSPDLRTSQDPFPSEYAHYSQPPPTDFAHYRKYSTPSSQAYQNPPVEGYQNPVASGSLPILPMESPAHRAGPGGPAELAG